MVLLVEFLDFCERTFTLRFFKRLLIALFLVFIGFLTNEILTIIYDLHV